MRRTRQSLALAAALAAAVSILPAASPAATLRPKIFATDRSADSYFGHSVAIDGDTAIIGAHGDSRSGSSAGAAYVFVRSGSNWIQQAALRPSELRDYDFFGISVAIDGDTAIVGAWGDDGAGVNAGAAYVFVRSGSAWTQQAKLTAADAFPNDGFGLSVAVSGNDALIGAPTDTTGTITHGSAYVFRRNAGAWAQHAKLTAAESAHLDLFGRSVALDNGVAVVGANRHDAGATDAGAVYVFAAPSWNRQAKLQAATPNAGDWFGFAVAVSGDTALIAAPWSDVAAPNAGAASVFVRTGSVWSRQGQITGPDPAVNDQFGYSVALSNNTAVVGIINDADRGPESGAAAVYVRRGNAWTLREKLVTPDFDPVRDNLGVGVGLSGDTAIVGAHRDDAGAPDTGSASIFDYVGCSPTEESALWTLETTVDPTAAVTPLAPSRTAARALAGVLCPDHAILPE